MGKVRISTTISAELRAAAKQRGIPLSYALNCGIRNILKQKVKYGTFDREQAVKLERVTRMLDNELQKNWAMSERITKLEEDLKKCTIKT